LIFVLTSVAERSSDFGCTIVAKRYPLSNLYSYFFCLIFKIQEKNMVSVNHDIIKIQVT
jgi:hypothetical protein